MKFQIKKKISLLMVLMMFSASYTLLNAQSKEAKKIIRQADKYFDNNNYKAAVLLYEDVIKEMKGDANINYKLGFSYLNTIEKMKSLPYLEQAFRLNPEVNEDIQLHLARAYHYNHKFKDALKHYSAYEVSLGKRIDDDVKKRLQRYEYECKNGIEYVANPVNATIENIGGTINTKYPEFVPVISADRTVMAFTSRREGGVGNLIEYDYQTGDPIGFYEDIYLTKFENGKWTTPRNAGKAVNTETHDACIALSPDGQKLYIYKDDGGGDIYVSNLVGEEWGKPVKLNKNINDKKTYEAHCSVTADENTIYFSSDRPGGYGGLDIWMSKKEKNGDWGEAVNMGPVINTEYDEDAPFIHADGRTLYFSSRGHKGMGGYDIFRTTFDGVTWTAPANIGYPINSADEDIYFVLSADNKYGYYASAGTHHEGESDGYGEKDIYVITMPPPEKIVVATTRETKTTTSRSTRQLAGAVETKTVSNPITILKGTITDALTGKPLESNLVLVDNDKNEVISEMKSNASTGKYLIILPSGKNYGLAVEKEDYMFHSENFDIPPSTDYQEVTKDVELKKIAVGTKIVLKNIFFDFDKATLRPESTAELARLLDLLNDVPNLKIEISGHTDSKGADDYNKKLSERRAKSVTDYLIAKGIAADRLRSAGYGEERPIATNDTDEGRQLNRRTEFEIIGN